MRLPATIVTSFVLTALPALAFAEDCDGLPATIVGTEGPDNLRGTAGDDVVALLGGDDEFDGVGGNDVICGDGGNDLLIGGQGDDRILGGDGDDDLRGATGNDQLLGGNDNDTLRGEEDADVLEGGPGDDVMLGAAGADACSGGGGVDTADSACEVVAGLDAEITFVTLYADDGTALDGELYVPVDDARNGLGTRQVAWVIRHGAQGSYANGVPQVAGLWGVQRGFTVLALNGRDWGVAAGGGNTLFEDTALDMGVGIEFLERLGFSRVFIAGHSGGTQAAGVYPALSNNDPRVAGIGLYGVVRDGREAATDVLFVPRNMLYDPYIELATDLVRQGKGQQVRDWVTSFVVPVQRSARTFLSYWGPDTRSVVVDEIISAAAPVFLLRAAGDGFTPDEWSRDVRDASLAAGRDATYVELPFRGPAGTTGVNAHGLLGVERQMMQQTLDWLRSREPATDQYLADAPRRISGNYQPIADAGPDGIIVTFGGDEAMLDGRSSLDLDGTVTSYRWQQTGGASVKLRQADAPMASFDVPRQTGLLAFRLTITDDGGATAEDVVSIDVTTIDLGGTTSMDTPLVALLGALLLARCLRARRHGVRSRFRSVNRF
jgi:pimeloyl-ACP methyl ester carboxylesterase